MGDIATELVGKPAIVLVGATHASSTSVPSEITTLFGRTYVLEATVSRGSFQRENISFQVSRIYRDPPMLPATHDAGIGSAGTSSSSQAALSDHQQTSDIPMVENIGNIISPAITKFHQQGMPVESTTLQITPAKPIDFTAAQEGIPIPCPSMMMASPVSLVSSLLLSCEYRYYPIIGTASNILIVYLLSSFSLYVCCYRCLP